MEELVNKRKPGLDSLGNPQSLNQAKAIKIKKLLLKCGQEKNRVPIKPFIKTIERPKVHCKQSP